MLMTRLLALSAALAAAASLSAMSIHAEPRTEARTAPAGGPLRVHRTNPRYFADARGRPVYLTGSHVWWNFAADRPWAECRATSPLSFSWPAHLRQLQRYGHNFIRLWRFELMRWRDCRGGFALVDLHPWQRTGPGNALDGRPRFDLTRFDPNYFKRLRDRIAAAQRRGIYVSVMLFEGWYVQYVSKEWRWRGHPYHAANNVNGVDGDVNGDGEGLEVHSLANRRVTAIQEAYVRKVIDTVNRFDNVLFEIVNESGAYSTAWQYRMIDLVKRYERRKAKRHPVGMTYQHGGDYAGEKLFASKADWVSPYGGGPAWLTDPAPTTGQKVVILDTDHLCGVCGGADFIWRAFLRGHSPIYMDIMDKNPGREAARRAMGQTRRFARRLDLSSAKPRIDLASTRFCLAAPSRQYLVYQPEGGRFWIDAGTARKRYAREWFDPTTGRTARLAARTLQGRQWFTPPWDGPAVLHLRAVKPPSRSR